MSDYLQSHGLQHSRPPCPLPTPRAYSNSCPSCQWCHPTVSSSVIPLTINLVIINRLNNKPCLITLLTKVHVVKAMVFPAVRYRCEGWTMKKAEHQRTDAFKLWCWRRLLRDLWTARRPNESILKEINLDYSLEGLMLKLKLQYFGHLMWITDSLEKTLMLGMIEGRRRRGWRRMR